MQPAPDDQRIRKGKFQGEPLDLRQRRSIQIVDETPEVFIVDYFFHDGQFFRARIPRGGVEKIIGQRFNFSVEEGDKIKWLKNPFVNHAQGRFVFQEGKSIELFPVGQEISNQTPLETLSDLVYSVEVIGPKGEIWSLKRAFGDFIAAHRICSIDEVVFERTVMKNYRVIQAPPLLLRAEERDRALELVIRRSDRAGMRERYYLFTAFFGARNCTSEIFDILDQILKPRYSVFQRLCAKFLWRLPRHLRSYLKVRGVIDSDIEMPTLSEEFPELRQSSKMVTRLAQIKSKSTR